MAESPASRGQLFSGEFLMSLVLFMAALIMVLGLWSNSTAEILRAEGMRTMEDMGVDASEALMRTPGIPSDWGVQNVTSLGLANESRVLLPAKVKAFSHYLSDNQSDLCVDGKNYECNLHMLGIGGYDMYFNLTYLNGSTVVIDGVPSYAGRRPVNDTEKMTVVRTALLNGEITRAYLTVWR
jgi:hypothetical protein